MAIPHRKTLRGGNLTKFFAGFFLGGGGDGLTSCLGTHCTAVSVRYAPVQLYLLL